MHQLDFVDILNPSPLSHRLRHCNNSSSNKIDKWPHASWPHAFFDIKLLVESLSRAVWSRTPWSRASNGVNCISTFLHPSHAKAASAPATDVYPSGCTAGRCRHCHCRPIDPTCSGSSHSCSPYSRATTHHRGQRDRLHIVATVNLDCHLDLKTIVLHTRNAEYNPKLGFTA